MTARRPAAALPVCALLVAVAAACGGASAPGQPLVRTSGDLIIQDAQTWSNQQVTMTGTLTIAAGGSLTLDNTTLLFSPAIQDTQAFVIQGGSFVARNNSLIKSGSGKQWNLEAHGACSVRFTGSKATNHSGLRMFDSCAFVADSSDVEETQVRDSSSVTLQNGAQAYLVLFFTGGPASFNNGEVTSGSGLTRSFTFPTGPGTTGHVNLANANVLGFQLDLLRDAALDITNGTNIVLAMHLDNVGNGATAVTNSSNITSGSSLSGAVDFSAYGNPKFTYHASQISSFNVYLTGTSNVSFTGTLDVTEPDAGGSSILTFGQGAKVYANLAMAHGTAQLIFNGSRLVDGAGSFPSFTALDQSVIKLNGVNPPADTQVQTVGQGQVQITGGSGWSRTMFETLNPVPPGGIVLQ